MSKASLHFNLPEEREEFETAVKAGDYKLALWETAQEVFRPARKHGYSDTKINDVLRQCNDMGEELVLLLEEKFYEILRERGIEL